MAHTVRFRVIRKETYDGSQHEWLIIRPMNGYGADHPGWYLMECDDEELQPHIREGSGVFRPELGSQLELLLCQPALNLAQMVRLHADLKHVTDEDWTSSLDELEEWLGQLIKETTYLREKHV